VSFDQRLFGQNRAQLRAALWFVMEALRTQYDNGRVVLRLRVEIAMLPIELT